MKLYSSDGSLLMEIKTIKPHADGLIIEGKIMGAMPMKALLKAEELQAGRKFLTWQLIRRVLGMLLARSSKDGQSGKGGQ